MIKLFCAVPTTGTVADAQTYFWREAERVYGDRIEFIWPEHCVRRQFHDFARNELAKEFLASKADVLFFLDSDVVPPVDVLDLLFTKEEWKLAGAPYPVFMTPPGYDRPQVVMTVYKGKNGGTLGCADVPDKGTEFVDGLATGCMFIRREVLEQMQEPYFEFKYDPTSRRMTEGEDLGFCLKTHAMGLKFFVDYSKVAKHYKTVCLLEVNNYAMDYARSSVLRFEAAVKEALRKKI